VARAFIIGGTGLIGRATARQLLAAGWQVDVTGRDVQHLPADVAAAGARFVAVDRDDGAALLATLPPDTDLLIDNIGYTAAQAELLVSLMHQVGSTVFMSSRAVYADAAGRHGNSPERPHFDGPITERQPTMAPRSDIDYNSAEGYGANKVAAENVVLDTGLPVTVLRPGKVHGEAAAPPRQWFWVKRALDQRPAVLFAGLGDHAVRSSAAANIAALVSTCAAKPGRRILNAGDPDCPTILEMSRIVAAHLGHQREEVLLGEDAPADLGLTPWDGTPNTPLDITAAVELGYVPVGDYATTVAAELYWLTSIAVETPDGAGLPAYVAGEFFEGRFDYDAEDRYLATR
jgi:nucleoside-diphosphate-sugar epimerase